MDPLVLIIYAVIACFFLAEGLILRFIMRTEQSGTDQKYSWFLTAGLILSTVCLLVSFTVGVYGTVDDRFGPRGLFAAANWISCAVFILLAGFRVKVSPFTYIFSASAALLFLWVALGLAH